MAAFRKDRHQRRMDWIETPLKVVMALPKIGLGLFAAIGIFLGIAAKRIAEVAVPFQVVARIVMWAGIAISVSYGPILLAAPWIGLAALWWTGRAHANAHMTGWAVAPADSGDGTIVITADTIVLAMQNLRDTRDQEGVQGRVAAGVPHAAGT